MEKTLWKDAKPQLNKNLVFLTFKTSWCPDCKMMEPVVKEVKNILDKENIKVNFINVDAEEADLLRSDDEWQVLKVPSFFFIKNGHKTHIGYEYIPAPVIVERIKKAL